jgi:hypothetical protein
MGVDVLAVINDLNPIKLVCGDIKNIVAQECKPARAEEMQMFCEKVFAEYSKE